LREHEGKYSPIFRNGEDVVEAFKPMRKGAFIKSTPFWDFGRESVLQQMFPLPRIESVANLRALVHANSSANELAAIRNRVVMEVEEAGSGEWVALVQTATEVHREVHGLLGTSCRWTLRRTTKHMVERHGKAYVHAAQSLVEKPLSNMDFKVKMFIKAEKSVVEEGAVLKTPRAIQYRGPRPNLRLAQYLCEFEAQFYSHYQVCRPGSRMHTSKGLSPKTRAGLVADLWHRNPAPMALCLDYSRFDAHVTAACLSLEHQFYLNMFPGDRELQWMLSQQLFNKGTGRWGTKYGLKGGRMSGDVNTALGNTLLNFVVLTHLTNGAMDFVCEGDDAVIFGNAGDIRLLVGRLVKEAAKIGFAIKAHVVTALDDVDYCSSRILEVRPGEYTSIRCWPKPLVTDPWAVKPVTSWSSWAEKARTMAVCAAVAYAGQPIYEQWAAYLLSHTIPDVGLDPWYNRDLWLRTQVLVRDTNGQTGVTVLARASFYQSTNIWPSEQLLLEQKLREEMGQYSPHVTTRELMALRES